SMNMPLTNHGGAGDDRAWPAAEGVQLRFLESAYHSRRIIWSLLFHGVFDRYPDIRLMISEIPGEWWPYLMKELDSITSMHGGQDQKGLQQIANRICAPPVDEVANPLSEVEVPEHHGLFSFRTVGPWA